MSVAMNPDELDVEVKRLRLMPGDVVILRCTREIPHAAAVRLGEQVDALLKAAGHAETKVLVLGPEVSVEVLEHPTAGGV